MLTVAGVALVVTLALGTRALVTDEAAPIVPTTAQLCAGYDALIAELDSDDIFGTQAAVRAARELSVMADSYVQPANGEPTATEDGPPVAQAGDDIRTVLGSVAWETRDLVTATRPVALECGWDWPVTTTPPPAEPQPPSS